MRATSHALLGTRKTIETRKVEDRQEAAINNRCWGDSERVRALPYKNAVSRRNLTSVVTACGTSRFGSRQCAARSTNDGDRMQFDRTNETRKWGGSDPLGAVLGAKTGAAKWGSLTPHLPPCIVAAALWLRHERHGALVEVADCQGRSLLRTSRHHVGQSSGFEYRLRPTGGTLLPHVRSPSVPSPTVNDSSQGETGCGTERVP